MNKLLIVEDDPNIAKGLMFLMNQHDIHSIWARNMIEAEENLVGNQFDLFLFDISLPDGSGLELCQLLRDRGMPQPIILLTARHDEDIVVRAFELGATDYVKKPFSNRELVARIKANLHRFKNAEQSIELNGLLIDNTKKICRYNDKLISLNRKQFDILYFLLINLNRVVSRDAMLNFINVNGDVLDRTIDSHISQLRKKMKQSGVESVNVKSVYGLGYTIEY